MLDGIIGVTKANRLCSTRDDGRVDRTTRLAMLTVPVLIVSARNGRENRSITVCGMS
jgi:hypothetical protein